MSEQAVAEVGYCEEQDLILGREQVGRRYREVRRSIYRSLIPKMKRSAFLSGVRQAAECGRPYATGKNGSESWWMYYPAFLERNPSVAARQAFEDRLLFEAHNQSGIFPKDLAFVEKYRRFYVEQVKGLDALGIGIAPPSYEYRLRRYYKLETPFIHYENQLPDDSIPDDPSNCFLPSLKGLRLLLVCPFGEVLRQQAVQETFEAVWAKTGKAWFDPASVDALGFPYGFHPDTQEKYGDVLGLYESITAEMDRRDFDVALIAAAGLGVPLAAHAKRLGRIGIDMGGYLQVLFGVLGKRWREHEAWMKRYVTDAWIEVPAEYRPARTDVCDQGAYW